MELQLIHSDKDQFSEATGYLMTAGLQQADWSCNTAVEETCRLLSDTEPNNGTGILLRCAVLDGMPKRCDT